MRVPWTSFVVAVGMVCAFPVSFTTAQSPSAISASATYEAESLYTTTVGASNVNFIVGAERFYNAGYSGANATMSNIEAGHINNTALYLTHVTTLIHGGGALGTPQTHATSVGRIMGGRPLGNITGQGIAPNATLYSGAIATSISGNSFGISYDSLIYPYTNSVIGFGAADVINSSWGFADQRGTDFITVALDGLAHANPHTTFVVAAGNAGSSADTVLGPASGYNSISVGALGGVSLRP